MSAKSQAAPRDHERRFSGFKRSPDDRVISNFGPPVGLIEGPVCRYRVGSLEQLADFHRQHVQFAVSHHLARDPDYQLVLPDRIGEELLKGGEASVPNGTAVWYERTAATRSS